MTSPRFARIRELFDACLELPHDKRRAYLDLQSNDDPSIAVEVRALLEMDQCENAPLADAAIQRASDELSETLPRSLYAGRTIGNYRVATLLGSGGMGQVFRARRIDSEFEVDVALKLMRADLLTPNLARRFAEERKTLATLSHPGICQFLDSGHDENGLPYVVMELIDGEPLLEYCNARRLGLEQRINLLRQVCAAVDFAHRSLVVHRDIKSSNVLVSSEGNAKLLDFGIAKALHHSGDHALTATSDRYFSPLNAAPEQIKGERIGVACDIYALGVLAYELLSGQPVFELEGLRPGEIERLLLDVPPALMSQRASDSASQSAAQQRGLSSAKQLARHLHGDLDAIVARCLRKSAAERYTNVEQFDQDLARVLTGQAIAARGGERWYRTRKFVQRHALATALSAALLITMSAALTLSLIQSYRLEQQRNEAVRERIRAEHVLALLRDSFAAADPARVAGADLTAKDIFEAAIPRIESLRDQDPQTYASLAHVIGSIQFDLGLDREAADTAKRALRMLPTSDSDSRPLRRELSLLQAEAQTGLRDLEAARAALESVAEMDGIPSLDWRLAKGRLELTAGDTDSALIELNAALNETRARTADDRQATQARLRLADALGRAERPQEAIRVMDELLAWQRASLAEHDPRITNARQRRIKFLLGLERSDEALTEARDIVAKTEAAYGPSSTHVGSAITSLGSALYNSGNIADAVDAFARALSVWEATLGPTHPHTVRATYNLAVSRALLPDQDAATRSTYLLAIDRARSRFGAASEMEAWVRLAFSRYLHVRGTLEEQFAALDIDNLVTGYPNWRKDIRAGFDKATEHLYASARCAAGGAHSRLICQDIEQLHKSQR